MASSVRSLRARDGSWWMQVGSAAWGKCTPNVGGAANQYQKPKGSNGGGFVGEVAEGA